MSKARIIHVLSFATLLGFVGLISAPELRPGLATVRLMSPSEMSATFGDNLQDHEAIFYTCWIIQYVEGSTTECHRCDADGDRKVCCKCKTTGKCGDTSTVACDGSACYKGTVTLGKLGDCREPPCDLPQVPKGTCGGKGLTCPTHNKDGKCTP